jgi:hypothetical protein
LWKWAAEEFELDPHERLVLLQACRCVDRLDLLETEAAANPVTVVNQRGDKVAHPALVESRQQSIVLTRLLASLRLPAGEQEPDARKPLRQQHRGPRGAYQPRHLGAV